MTLSTNPFGKTGRDVTRIGFGAWAIGGSWGDVSEADAKATLHAALDSGQSFIDTADVYGDGRSERLIRDVLRERGEKPFVATKAGRRLDPHVAAGYTPATIEAFIDRSLTNLGLDCLDLVQLHCPPTEVYYTPALFEGLDALKAKGKIAQWGVSVEKVEEALKAIEYPGCASVQIIYNIFRQRPASLFFRQAKTKGVATITRVPLASGMLTGKMTAKTAPSPPTTTAPSTAMARPSTRAKPSRACPMTWRCKRWRSCARWSRRGPRWPSSPCAGS